MNDRKLNPRVNLHRMDMDLLSMNSDSDVGTAVRTDEEDNILEIPTSSKEVSNSQLMAVLQSVKSDTADTRQLLGATRGDLYSHIKKSNEQFDMVKADIEKATNDIGTLFARIRKCEVGSSISSYDSELQKQGALKNNISVAGIPRRENEDLRAIFRSILRSINLSLNDNAIASIYRINESRSHLIIVKFTVFETKLEMMKARRNKKILVRDIISINEGTSSAVDQEVFINNQITPYFGNLLFHGRKAIDNNCIQSCWISNRGFVIRKSENDIPIEIKSVDHLTEFTQTKCQKRRSDEVETSPIDKDNPRTKQRVVPGQQRIIRQQRRNRKEQPKEKQITK